MVLWTALLALAPTRPLSQDFEGRAASKNGDIVVTWKVRDGYKISLTVDTSKKKGAYQRSSEGDVFAIHVDFIDAGPLTHVVIEHGDETGFSPRVLITRDRLTFVDALRNFKKSLYVETVLEKPVGTKGYRVTRGADGSHLLVFTNVVIGGTRYRDAVFRFDDRTSSYALLRTGENLGPQGGGE